MISNAIDLFIIQKEGAIYLNKNDASCSKNDKPEEFQSKYDLSLFIFAPEEVDFLR